MIMQVELAAEIAKRFGNVRRARGCYLYTEKNVRLTDCFLDGGRALLGWDGGKARTVFKDTLERGANGSYCAGYESRLATAVRHLLPAEYTEIRWYYDASCAADGPSSNAAAGENNTRFGASPVLWRPWIDICAQTEPKPTRYPEITITHLSGERPAVIKLVPPFPWATTLSIYAFRAGSVSSAGGSPAAKSSFGAEAAAFGTSDATFKTGSKSLADPAELTGSKSLAESADSLPPSDFAPAPLLAAYARAFYDLKTALAAYGEKDFRCHSKQLSPLFERRACWLFPTISRESYPDLFLRCLDKKILLSPDYDTPSIIPWRANKGDMKGLADSI
ncbi:MAG: hypothetical protein K5930_01430 [Treponemataceae bacterium]|nr:hypothetical protein [Treponemataceae bacterium]